MGRPAGWQVLLGRIVDGRHNALDLIVEVGPEAVDLLYFLLDRALRPELQCNAPGPATPRGQSAVPSPTQFQSGFVSVVNLTNTVLSSGVLRGRKSRIPETPPHGHLGNGRLALHGVAHLLTRPRDLFAEERLIGAPAPATALDAPRVWTVS